MSANKTSRPLAVLSAMAALLVALLLPGVAVATDIASEPLITMPNVKAKPNLMFILDSSGSMAGRVMPDDQNGSGSYGYWALQCNGLAYDPTMTYDPPVDSAGTSFANASFGAAWDNGIARSGAIDLANTTSITTSSVAVGTGRKSFVISTSGMDSGTFSVGDVVTITSGSTRSMTGTVTDWDRTSTGPTRWTLIVNVSSSSGSGSATSWIVTTAQYYYTYTGSQPVRSWTYGSDGNVVDNTFYKECQSSIGSTPGRDVFTRVNVTASSTDATNYANWYSYYRTRMLLMQTAVGQAFSGLDDGYRIGFTTIRYNGISDDGDTSGDNPFRNVKTFNQAQKTNFYSSLYKETPNDATPLRGALSKVGRYFAKKISGQTYDPMEYSCQRNYAILTTDGYWNTRDETTTYGPLAMDGSTRVGNTDKTEVRPMYDGTTAVSGYGRTRYVVGRQGRNGCSSSTYRLTETPQTCTSGCTNNSSWTDGQVLRDECVSGSTPVNGSTAASRANSTSYSAATSTPVYSGGSESSLADVAEYYYKTDLRDTALNNCDSQTESGVATKVCYPDVPTSGRDDNAQQHLTTFTIGLGVPGTLAYDKNYLSQVPNGSGAYRNLTDGPTNWPVPVETSIGGDARNIDDLWHAAVNGRGQYYSALNADELKAAIEGVKNQIQEVTGAAAAAVTNRLELVTGGDNVAYQASYTTTSWVGDMEAYKLDSSTGLLASTPNWSAKTKLDATAPSSRNIKFNSGGALVAFTYSNLTGASMNGHFDGLCSKSVVASQCSGFTGAQETLANGGTNLVDFLRGVRTYEASNIANPLYRTRKSVLGDIINSSPVYVGAPPFSYTDTGYGAYKTAKASRAGRVYVGANDGMLHAFDVDEYDQNGALTKAGGNEVWAFVPTAVMPNLYKLADSSYASRHAYFVDGTPVVGDVYDSATSSWKTILVGGLNAGGKSYYALDITDPSSPSLLWEFTDTNLGLTFGNPMIVKRSTGKWVVVFASGYNYTGAVGQEQLFVLDAISGTKEKILLSDGTAGTVDLSLTLGEGSSSDPNGLAKINAWIADSTNNTALRFYGGDLKGNLWRFDLDNVVPPNHAALKLAQFQTSAGVAEPITVQPRLKLVENKAVVMVGTGRYLGVDDIVDTTTQSVAAIKDPLTNTGWGVVRNNAAIKQSTVTLTDPDGANPTTSLLNDDAAISAPNPPVNWASDGGWWFDLPVSKERVVAPMAVGGNKLLVASAIPSGDACTTGGASRLYQCDIPTGGCTGELFSESALIVGMTLLTTDKGDLVVLIRDSTGKTTVQPVSGGTAPGVGTAHRTSWRELVD